jgi:hypothetical protein
MITTTRTPNPNNQYWQDASKTAAGRLAKMLTWNEYDRFFAALDGASHMQIAQACQSKIAELQKPRGRETMRRIITTGVDDRGNKMQYMENGDGTWTDLYNEMIVDGNFVMRHFPHLLTECSDGVR